MPPALVEIAADGATAFRAERERKQPVGIRRALLRIGEDHAGFDGHGVGLGVDRTDFVEAAHGDDDLAVMRDLAADKAGVAALRYQRGPGFAGKLADRRDFRRRAGRRISGE
jgi:hypothetical protein